MWRLRRILDSSSLTISYARAAVGTGSGDASDAPKSGATSFSKATFAAAGTDETLDVTDALFWQKVRMIVACGWVWVWVWGGAARAVHTI